MLRGAPCAGPDRGEPRNRSATRAAAGKKRRNKHFRREGQRHDALPMCQSSGCAGAAGCLGNNVCPPPPVAMATRGAAPFPPSPAPARRARGAPGASPARGRPSAVTRPRGGLCRGALPGRGSWGDTGAERGCGAGGGRRGPVRSGGAGQRDSAAPGSAGPAGRFKGREGCNKEGAGTAALIVCEMLFVHRPVIRIIWAVGISARFPSQLRACGHGAGCSVRGCWWDPRPGGIGGVFMGTQGCFLWVTGNGFLKLEIITLVVLYACKQLHGQCRNLNQI